MSDYPYVAGYVQLPNVAGNPLTNVSDGSPYPRSGNINQTSPIPGSRILGKARGQTPICLSVTDPLSHQGESLIDVLTSKNVYCTDIGDDNGFMNACQHYEQTMNDNFLLAFADEDDKLSGKTVYRRGSKGYYNHVLKPRIDLIKNVSNCFEGLDIVPALYTFTTNTANFASQTSAWMGTKEDMNRTLTFLRKSALGKRDRIYVKDDGSVKVFSRPRPAILAYYLISEDTAAHYPAFHLLVLYNGSDLGTAKTDKLTGIVRRQHLRLINDELTCLQQLHGFGFTKISEPKKEFCSIFDAVSYMTKYLSKGFDSSHKEYDVSRSVAWISCLKTTGKRLFSMSRVWTKWSDQSTTKKRENDLNINYSVNSNVKKRKYRLLAISNDKNGQFSSLVDMLLFFTARKPPPDVLEVVFSDIDLADVLVAEPSSRRRLLVERKRVYRGLLDDHKTAAVVSAAKTGCAVQSPVKQSWFHFDYESMRCGSEVDY